MDSRDEALMNRVEELMEELSFANGGMFWYDHRREYERVSNLLCQIEMGGMRDAWRRDLVRIEINLGLMLDEYV